MATSNFPEGDFLIGVCKRLPFLSSLQCNASELSLMCRGSSNFSAFQIVFLKGKTLLKEKLSPRKSNKVGKIILAVDQFPCYLAFNESPVNVNLVLFQIS